jgi:nitrogen regulatory protein P-II 1
MKKIEAIIRPERVNSVISALGAAGHHGVTVYEVAGHGKQRSHAEHQGDHEVQLRPKVMLIIAVKDSDLNQVVKVILETSKTDMVGDGKIFVSELSEVIRIRTGEHNEKAIG